MTVYHNPTPLAKRVREKQMLMREIYGTGTLSLKQAMQEINIKNKDSAKRYLESIGVPAIMDPVTGRRKYDGDVLARRLVETGI